MEFGVRERKVLRWQRWSWKEVETAFVMVRAKRITEDGEKEGEREGDAGTISYFVSPPSECAEIDAIALDC